MDTVNSGQVKMKQAEIWFHMKKVPIYEDIMYQASTFWYSKLTWDHWEFQLWKVTWHDSQELDFVKSPKHAKITKLFDQS
jgi:hypothetical protein